MARIEEKSTKITEITRKAKNSLQGVFTGLASDVKGEC